MCVGNLELLYFIISLWVRILVSPFDAVEAKDETVYAMGINCVPGTYVTNTECQKCPNGTFSDKNNATKCSPCDRCSGRHNEIVKPCTSYSNTNCSCQSGYYYSTSLSFCLRCTQCKKGRGVVRSCTATDDTECDLCVKGQTFSPEKNMEKCRPCRRCPKGHIVQKNCTRRTDTVCVPERDRNNSKAKPLSPGTMATRPPPKNKTTTTKKKRWKTPTRRVSTEHISVQNHSFTPVSILSENTDIDEDEGLQAALYALIALVVVLVIVFVLVCWYKRRNRRRKKPKPGVQEPSTRSSSTDVIEAVENPYSSLPFISTRQGQEKMLRDVPYTLISDLSYHLNAGERWKQLGGQLKFNTTQINTFALEKKNATQAMLQEWMQKDGSTVVALQNTFRKMKWTREERMVGKYV